MINVVILRATQVRWDARSTLQALCQTCHGLRRLALPALFETLHLHFRPKRDTGCQMLHDLQDAGDELLCCVRVFIVSGDLGYMTPHRIPRRCSHRPWCLSWRGCHDW